MRDGWIAPLAGGCLLFGGLLLSAASSEPELEQALRQTAIEEHGLGPLAELPVPEPSNLEDFVRDWEAALVLGKAL